MHRCSGWHWQWEANGEFHSSTKVSNELAKPIRINAYKTLESSQKWTTREKLGEERRCWFVGGECCGILNHIPTIPQYPNQWKAGDSSQHTWWRLLCHHSHHLRLPLRGEDYTGCTQEGLEFVYTSSNSTHHRKRFVERGCLWITLSPFMLLYHGIFYCEHLSVLKWRAWADSVFLLCTLDWTCFSFCPAHVVLGMQKSKRSVLGAFYSIELNTMCSE